MLIYAICIIAYLVLYSCIVLASLFGDYLLSLLPVESRLVHYAIALSDTAIHGVIGSLSWCMLVAVQLCNSFRVVMSKEGHTVFVYSNRQFSRLFSIFNFVYSL